MASAKPQVSDSDIRKTIKNALKSGKTINVTFTKKDGTLRTLRGCLNADLIPKAKLPKGVAGREPNDEVQAIFDLDASEWRSFRYDSVSKVALA